MAAGVMGRGLGPVPSGFSHILGCPLLVGLPSCPDSRRPGLSCLAIIRGISLCVPGSAAACLSFHICNLARTNHSAISAA